LISALTAKRSGFNERDIQLATNQNADREIAAP
jgi:hypothetical protein